jgi:glucose-6-phosphate dehydrogenase assembly protein OpcA
MHHWGARATSVGEIETELARIWSLAAREAELEGMTPAAEADALGDPRVAPRLEQRGDVRVRARTSVLSLVVVATRPETLDRVLDAIGELAGRHPSRAIVLAPGDPDGPSSLDARISLECTVRPASVTETCAERILVHAGGETAQHLAGIATPLLIHDLPVVLWWADDPPLGSRQLRELTETCDQLLIDSGAFRDDGTACLAALAMLVAGGDVAVHDIGWMRLTLWRELLGALFDHPLLTPELSSLHSLRLDVVRPSTILRISKAACFAGWLAAALHLDVSRPLQPRRNSESLVGTWTDGHREIRVEFRPVVAPGSAGTPPNGSLQRVELELGRGRRVVRARVSRQADHLLATADWDGAEVVRRAGGLELFNEAPYVAESLNRLGHDWSFEEAIARAARLVGA